MQNVVVFIEHKGGTTRKVTFELATEARIMPPIAAQWAA